MKIALAQIFCPWGDRSGNLRKIEWFSRQARAAGAELVAFPELTVSGIFKDVRIKEIAEPLNGYSVKWVSALARSIGITIGFGFTEKAEPLPFNTYCLIDSRGKPAAVYRKIYIPRLEVPYWQGGRQRPVFRVAGKRLTIAICWDATQEELLAHYNRQKAEIVLMPHAWDSDPLDKNGKPLDYNSMAELINLADAGNLGGWKSFTEMRDYFYSYIPGYAKKYRFAACFVNQTGQPHKYLRFVGPTFAVDRQGRILAEMRNEEEGLLYVDI
ncbi:MAG: carbon-nitrogen hydrolase family protein [Candidatus Glassbacteria bacterium]